MCYYVYICNQEMICKLKKLQEKQRRWLLAKSRTAMRKLQKKNKYKHKNIFQQSKNVLKGNNKRKINIVEVPCVFSIINNSDDTLRFFNDVYDVIKKLKVNDKLFFNLAEVEVVTVDAIMYLIALIKNTERLKMLKIDCAGSVPLNEEAKRVIETSGFYEYVQPNYKIKYVDCSNINISSGFEADPKLVGDVCDFVHKNSCLDRIDTKSLYSMINELMTNTKQHAYNYNRGIKNKWYIFAENCDDYIQFVFLDTGEGIPNTIRTNFFEKIRSKLNNSDAYFISSALKGAFRTETKLDYRGKGLPEIYNRISERIISDFSIVSCGGRCNVDADGTIQEEKLSSDLKGTLFYWKLNKCCEEIEK